MRLMVDFSMNYIVTLHLESVSTSVSTLWRFMRELFFAIQVPPSIRSDYAMHELFNARLCRRLSRGPYIFPAYNDSSSQKRRKPPDP